MCAKSIGARRGLTRLYFDSGLKREHFTISTLGRGVRIDDWIGLREDEKHVPFAQQLHRLA